MKLKWKILIVILVIILAIVGCNYIIPSTQTTNDINTQNNIEIVQQEENIIIEEKTEDEEEKVEVPAIELITMYTTTGVNLRTQPSLDSEIVEVLYINTPIQVVETEDEWTEVYKDDNIYYISTKYISKTETEIKKTEIKVTSRGSNSLERENDTIKVNTTTSTVSNGNVLTKSKGVNYFNGHKETWYSQKVLPGGGLNIPGRHVNAQGLVCDGDEYICVASSDYPKGTIVETSLGTGKVYDSGCAKNTIDIYVDW